MEKLADKKPDVEDRSGLLRDIAMGLEKSQVFLTAVELNVFTKLKEPKTAEALSMELGTHQELTHRFLDILAALGVLAKHGNQYITVPSVAPFLIEGEPYNLNLKHYWEHVSEERDDWVNLKQILKTNHSSRPDISAIHEHKFDSDLIGWIARWTMLGRLQATLKVVSKLSEFKNARRLIDLGGGHGLFAIGFAQENPKLEAIVFDQPEVTKITQEYIAKYGMQDRVRTIAGDFTKDDLGSNYDIAFESLAHYEPKERMIAFYRRVHAVLNDSGLLITQRHTIDNNENGPLWSLVMDMNWRMHYGRPFCFTNDEFFTILEKSGFSGDQIIDMSEWSGMPIRLIIARKRTLGISKFRR